MTGVFLSPFIGFKCVKMGFLEASIDKFIDFVLNNQQLTFYLTKIGCGIAGWDIEEVKRIFWKVVDSYNPVPWEGRGLPANLIIPKEFDHEK